MKKPSPSSNAAPDWLPGARTFARACDGGAPEFPVNQEFQPVHPRVSTAALSCSTNSSKAARWISTPSATRPTSELELYCHRVASVVGLLSIEIFGYQNPACRDYAVHLGKALQLTNILRDVRTDAGRGRIYLPLAELKQFNVTEAEILRHEYSERFANSPPAWPPGRGIIIGSPGNFCRPRTAGRWSPRN